MWKRFIIILVLSMFVFSFSTAEEESKMDHSLDGTRAIRVAPEEEHYIFELDEDVARTHVYYQNRFGIELAADLYMAKDMDLSVKHPAIIIRTRRVFSITRFIFNKRVNLRCKIRIFAITIITYKFQ